MEFGSTRMEELGPIQTFVGRLTGRSIAISTDSQTQIQTNHIGRDFQYAKTKKKKSKIVLFIKIKTNPKARKREPQTRMKICIRRQITEPTHAQTDNPSQLI